MGSPTSEQVHVSLEHVWPTIDPFLLTAARLWYPPPSEPRLPQSDLPQRIPQRAYSSSARKRRKKYAKTAKKTTASLTAIRTPAIC